METVTNVSSFHFNPEGIVPFSPGLPQRGYPGKEAPNHPTPTGLCLRVIAVVHGQAKMVKPSTEIEKDSATRWSQPRWGCRIGWTLNPG
jgi:hypothetical protein